MEVESFEDNGVAKLLNENFVCIKVGNRVILELDVFSMIFFSCAFAKFSCLLKL